MLPTTNNLQHFLASIDPEVGIYFFTFFFSLFLAIYRRKSKTKETSSVLTKLT
jgi:hypothetical protein